MRLLSASVVTATACLWLVAASCEQEGIVVYCSLDEPYSGPILAAFERDTGIRVQTRYDTEADKTVGLAYRLIEERRRPRADVFWNSEVVQTIRLARKDALSPYVSSARKEIPPSFHGRDELWTGFAARVRVLIYNTDLVSDVEAPRSIADLASPRWRGQATMARPFAGTTSTHAGALWARLGAARAKTFFRGLKENDVHLAHGNAHVRDLVVRGAFAIGVTDTDDAHEAIRRGDPIRIVFPDQEAEFPGLAESLGAFFIPNTVALVAGGPNPERARKLIDYLLSEKVETDLSKSGSAQIPVRTTLDAPEGLGVPKDLHVMAVNYEDAERALADAEPFLRELFLR